jgi:hypothetical protein
MKRVYIASPFSAPTPEGRSKNIDYAIECGRDAMRKGEAVYIPHLYLTRMLNDHSPVERTLGMAVGKAFLDICDALVLYCDKGVSRGMREEARYWQTNIVGRDAIRGYGIVFRRLDGGPLPMLDRVLLE